MKGKKLLAFALAIAMSGMPVANSIPLSRIIDSNTIIANAEDDNAEDIHIWDGTADTSWYDSEETELHIRTAEEFAGMAKLSNSGGIDFTGQSIYLDNDIYLNENDSTNNLWSCINCFYGDFYGNNHIISNIYTDTGLFHQVNGKIVDLHVEKACFELNPNFGNGTYTILRGGICNYTIGDTCIYNCSFNGIVNISINEAISFGGICGNNNNKADEESLLQIKNCIVDANITITNRYRYSIYNSKSTGIAGIIGTSIGNLQIEECSMTGKIEYNGSHPNFYIDIGGICGDVSNAKISKCLSKTDIVPCDDNYEKFTSYSIGGIIGWGGDNEIISCYNTGQIVGASHNIAGICDCYPNTIQNVYNIGTINNQNDPPIGDSNSNMSNAYYLNTSSTINYLGTISKTEENMKKDSFALALGDDFVYVPGEYPKLKWEVGEDFQKFKKDQISFNEYGQNEKLELSTSYGGTINWVSDDPKIATVDKNGIVTALANGSTKIYAICGDTQAVCTVNVDYGYSLNKKEINLEEAAIDSIYLISKNTNEKFDTIKPVFKSSDEDIAIVDENGEITAIKSGKCVISAEIGDCKLQCNVSVYEPKKKPSLDKATITIDNGKKDSINVLNYTGKVTWVSADTKVVNVNGKDNSPTAEIEAVGEGKTTIYAMLSTGKNLACEVTVNKNATTTTNNKNVKYGDSNCDGNIDVSDAVLIMQSICNPSKYGVNGSDSHKITSQGQLNADCCNPGDGVTNLDALAIQKYKLELIKSLPEKAK